MLRAELIKSATVRTVPAIVVLAAVLVALTSASVPPAQLQGAGLHDLTAYFISSIVIAVLAIVLGARTFTDEFRHGSIVPTLTLSPRRGRVLAVKMLISAFFGALLALVAMGVMVAIMTALAGVKEARPEIGDDALRAMGGLVGASALWAAVGAGVGAAVRSQVVAIVGALVWVAIFENVATGVLGGIASYLPGRVGYAVANVTASPDLVAPGTGAVLLIRYTVAFGLLGFLLLRRDVSGA